MHLSDLEGRQLEFRTRRKTRHRAELTRDAQTVVRALNEATGSRSEPGRSSSLLEMAMKAHDLRREHVQEVRSAAFALLPAVLAEHLASAVPYVGQIVDAVTSVRKTMEAKARRAARRTIRELGEPDFTDVRYFHASVSVGEYLKAESHSALARAALHAAKAAVRLIPGSSLAVTATGAAASIVLALNDIAYLVKMKVRGNEALANGWDDDEALLEEVPILACFMLAFNDTRQAQFAHHKRDRDADPVYVKNRWHHKVRRKVSSDGALHEMKHPTTAEYGRYRVLMVEARRIATQGWFVLDPPLTEEEFVDFSASSDSGSSSSSSRSSSSGGSSSASSSSSSSSSRRGSVSG